MAEAILPSGLDALLGEFSRSGLRKLHLRAGDFELYLSRDAGGAGLMQTGQSSAMPLAVAQPQAATPETTIRATPAAIPPGAVVVCAPNLGTFYRAPKPGSEPYVEIGSAVTAEVEICLIEVMKLFTAVRAGIGGRVHAILAEDGQMVEAGQPLFAIMPD